MADKSAPKVVEATGKTIKPPGMSAAIEKAMADAQHAAAAETGVIYGDKNLSDEDKRKKIAAVMSPKALLERKLAARKAAREAWASPKG